MPEFSADLNRLVSVARSWENAATDLEQGAQQLQNIQYSNKEVVWGLFQDAWTAHVAAAQYMHDRLTEGRKETDSMGATLQQIAKVFMEQDQNFANILLKIGIQGVDYD